MSIKVVVLGAAGRTGGRIVALVAKDSDLKLVAAIEGPDCDVLGRDAGELAGVGAVAVPVTSEYAGEFDVVIDFSTPRATIHWLAECTRQTKPMVSGTTGHDDIQLERIHEASKFTPVLKAPNMSVGVNVLLRIAEQLGSLLDEAYDVEISEAHHRFKVDAPSGTALALRDAVCRGRTANGGSEPEIIYGRQGTSGERPVGQIGMHSLRIGDTVGEHTVAFGTLGETVTIGHSAHSRDTFALGAVRAAKWIIGRPAGLYSMQDVLFGADQSRDREGAVGTQ